MTTNHDTAHHSGPQPNSPSRTGHRGHVSSGGTRPFVDQWTDLRFQVLEAAQEGRATYLPAGARNNPTARVLIDGKDVGQASVLMHYVKQDLSANTRFAEVPLLPNR